MSTQSDGSPKFERSEQRSVATASAADGGITDAGAYTTTFSYDGGWRRHPVGVKGRLDCHHKWEAAAAGVIPAAVRVARSGVRSCR